MIDTPSLALPSLVRGDVETWRLVKSKAYILKISRKIWKISAKLIEFSSKNKMYYNRL